MGPATGPRRGEDASWEVDADKPKPKGETRARRSYCTKELTQRKSRPCLGLFGSCWFGRPPNSLWSASTHTHTHATRSRRQASHDAVVSVEGCAQRSMSSAIRPAHVRQRRRSPAQALRRARQHPKRGEVRFPWCVTGINFSDMTARVVVAIGKRLHSHPRPVLRADG